MFTFLFLIVFQSISTLSFHGCRTTSLYTQPDAVPPLTNEEFFTQAEIVFEGYFLKTVAIYDSKGNDKYNSKWDDCYRIDAYVIQRIYKGADCNEGDRIFIVSQGAWLGELDYLEKYNDCGTLGIYRHGFECIINTYSPKIFFLVLSDFPDDINSKYASYKKYKYVTSYRDWSKDAYREMYICGDKMMGLDSLFFHQREDFYDYMKQFEGFTVPELAPKPENH
jgi:hypothetical protein